MNQFLKIALDHPAKAEKIFLWLLQSLIVIWLISLVFHVRMGSCFYSGDNSYIGEQCLKSISAIHIATAVVLFAVTYVLCWEIFADLFVRLIFRILGRIGNLLFTIVLNVLLYPIYLFLLIKAIAKKTDKPLKYWSSNETETESSTNDYIKNQVN